MNGKTLRHYQAVRTLDEGGMAEVRQAKNQMLGRHAAIKVLPDEFSWDADRAARFRREAKLPDSPNHTNNAASYGLEKTGGTSKNLV